MPMILVAGFKIFLARPPNPATIHFGIRYTLLQQYHYTANGVA